MVESHRRAKLLREASESAGRLLENRRTTAESLACAETRERLKRVARPNSVSGTLRKTGVALILAPDPVTAVPGVVMLGASVAAKRREPIAPRAVVEEALRLVEEMGSNL